MATNGKRKRSAKANKAAAPSPPSGNGLGLKLARTTAPRQLDDPSKRAEWGLPALGDDTATGSYIVELNVQHAGGIAGAEAAFHELFRQHVGQEDGRKAGPSRQPEQIAKSYYRCDFTDKEWRLIVRDDESRPLVQRAIYRLWPDFPVKTTTDRSVATIKSDAALQSFDAGGENIVWAVVDSGVDASHPHFGPQGSVSGSSEHLLLGSDVANLHRSFTSTAREDGEAWHASQLRLGTAHR